MYTENVGNLTTVWSEENWSWWSGIITELKYCIKLEKQPVCFLKNEVVLTSGWCLSEVLLKIK